MSSLLARSGRLLPGAACLLLGATAVAGVPPSPGRVLVVRGSIQGTLDAARPGDTVFVPPGAYRESLRIATSGLTLVGPRTAVIDARGFETAVRVGGDEVVRDDSGTPVCPAPSVRDFRMLGLTVRQGGGNGTRLVGVDGFQILGGRYLGQGESGISVVCSRHGLVAHNEVSRRSGPAVAASGGDHVWIARNQVTGNTVGIVIENTTNAVVRSNLAARNTAGIVVGVLPDRPFPFSEHVRVEGNWVVDNNLPNPASLESDHWAAWLPSGTGILNVGGDAVSVRDNWVVRNGSVGVAVTPSLGAALDPRVDPFPDTGEVRGNRLLANGRSPDPALSTLPAADLVYVPDLIDPQTGEVLAEDPAPDGCFAPNVFETEVPAGLAAAFPCG